MPNSQLPMEFHYSMQSKSVHIELIDNEPFFLAKDVCDVLELENVTKALYSLDEDEKLTLPVVRSGQTREMNFVNESGLYNLIFQSRKPAAKKFRKWVTNEVLPSIRKTGGYGKALASYNLSVDDIFKYCDQVQHEGLTWYAAKNLRTLLGKQPHGQTNRQLEQLQNDGFAIKMRSKISGQVKWFVRREAVGRLMNIRPTSPVNISRIQKLQGGSL